jgi:hypothetical protein
MATPKRDKELTAREQRIERKAAFAKKGQGDAGAALWDAYQDIDSLEHTVELLQVNLAEARSLNEALEQTVDLLHTDNLELIGNVEKAERDIKALKAELAAQGRPQGEEE